MQKTYPSIKDLHLNEHMPTLICDADEVIFDFMNEFLIFMKQNDLKFNWKSYALTGNIIKKNKIPLNEYEVKALINKFFKNCTLTMNTVNGVVNAFKKISKYYNIVILSNIPFEFYNLRKKALIKNNLVYPFFANTGEKGSTSSYIFSKLKKKTWFIDDSPFQVSSVRKKQPKIRTILFVANTKLAKLIIDKKEYDFYTTNWTQNTEILLNNF